MTFLKENRAHLQILVSCSFVSEKLGIETNWRKCAIFDTKSSEMDMNLSHKFSSLSCTGLNGAGIMFFCNSRHQEKEVSATATFTGYEHVPLEGDDVLSSGIYVMVYYSG